MNKGLVIAAMLAAAMQTCSAALNSTATLVAYDLFKRYQPDISDHRLVFIGKATTIAGTLLAIVASPLFGRYTTIFEGINKVISYGAPPISAVFLLGVFWKRASGKAALITLLAGMALGFMAFYLDWNHIYRGDFMLVAFLVFVACVLIMIVTRLIFPQPLKAEARDLVWENWTAPLRARCGSGLSDYRVISAMIVVIFALLYIAFR
jgi:SSS family solute:Na+ symporter